MRPSRSPLLRPNERLASQKHRGSSPPMSKPSQRAHAVNAPSARIGLIRPLRNQCNNNPTTSNSATPASDPTATTPTTDNNIDAPPPPITDTILPPPLPAPITATNTTCPTPTTSVATSDYLPPAISNTTAAPVPAMGTRY
ncbi:unnamed protein product [Schistocephalus solidus]|uniref:Uncharacterized protein n=1 Tax=Schistocephalus solidus TaxID=70667 RepID=A0A183SFB1_SCHSO|nr:unnamed protein product [Schistocephalus solidus]